MCVYEWVCIYVMCTCMYVCFYMHISTCVYVCIGMCAYLHVHVCMIVGITVGFHLYSCVCLCMGISIYMYVYMCVWDAVYMYVYMCAWDAAAYALNILFFLFFCRIFSFYVSYLLRMRSIMALHKFLSFSTLRSAILLTLPTCPSSVIH